jgi:hypothetical protein
MMVALLVYAYAIGERSSRAIERRCREDVAFRVITANRIPDHATIARFRVRHQEALGDLFGQVLGLCGDAGLVFVGVAAVGGSKFAASASDKAVRSYEQIAAKIIEEAGRRAANTRPATSAACSSAAANRWAPGRATTRLRCAPKLSSTRPARTPGG